MINIKTFATPKETGSSSSTSEVTNTTIVQADADNWFFFDSDSNSVGCRYDLYSVGNVSAFGADPVEGGGTAVNVYDGLDSTSTTEALAANQGRILKEYIDSNCAKLPVVLYETDGTTGLLGVNNNALGYNWQLEDYDFTPFKFLRCYIKEADMSMTGNALTPSMIIDLPLDEAALAKTANDSTTISPKTPCDIYVAGGSACNPSDQNRVFNVLVAVDSTKTKFQVVCENSLYGTAQTNRNTDGRYCYKIEGYYDGVFSGNMSGGGGSSGPVDWSQIQNKPSTFTPSPHTHTMNDVTGLNSQLSFYSSSIAAIGQNLETHKEDTSVHLSQSQFALINQLLNIFNISGNTLTINGNIVATGNITANLQ